MERAIERYNDYNNKYGMDAVGEWDKNMFEFTILTNYNVVVDTSTLFRRSYWFEFLEDPITLYDEILSDDDSATEETEIPCDDSSEDGACKKNDVPTEQPKQPEQKYQLKLMDIPSEKEYTPPIDDYTAKYNIYKKTIQKRRDKDYADLMEAYRSFSNDDRLRWNRDAKETYNLYRTLETLTDNDRDKSSEKDSMPKNARMPNDYEDPYSLYRGFKEQSGFLRIYPDPEYERIMEIQSDITYRALLRQIQIAEERYARDPINLYKYLNRKFKRSNTEDFFRDPVASVVEVLESFSLWVAEKLSLPPPEPVNQDEVIYKKKEKEFNYTTDVAAILNKRNVKFLYTRYRKPTNNSYGEEAIGYEFLNQD